ncbi:MAG: hypothetical protein SF339_07610 [Blastocatellia bacterium]|nr:hypothetical protein [Blastocatellia bacterium]
MKLNRGILEQMNEYLQRCPRCRQIWMVFNQRGEEQHQCRACGHRFTREEGKIESGPDIQPKAA